MTFDGTNTEDNGLVVSAVQGLYSMPGRLDPFAYNWGDQIEPLFNSGWANRTGVVRFLFDPRTQTVPTPFDTVTQTYLDATQITLALTEAAGAVGQHNVFINSIQRALKFNTNFTSFWNFTEPVPAFPGTVPGTKDGGTESIDGYAFSQFGLVVGRANNIQGLGDSFRSSKTVYKEVAPETQLRNLHAFTLDCYIVGNSSTDALQKLHSFQKVLTKEGTMPFVYDGNSFDVFFTSGFVAAKIGSRLFKFVLPLNRL